MSRSEYDNAREKAQKMSDQELYRMCLVLNVCGFEHQKSAHEIMEYFVENRALGGAREYARSGLHCASFADAYFDESANREPELPKEDQNAIRAEFGLSPLEEASKQATETYLSNKRNGIPFLLRQTTGVGMVLTALMILLFNFTTDLMPPFFERITSIIALGLLVWGVLACFRGFPDPPESKITE